MNAANGVGMTPLLFALRSAQYGNVDRTKQSLQIARFLIKRGANPNLKDKFNSAPLQYAVQPQRQFDGMEASPIMVDMAKLLLEYGGLCET